jgi:hypothetical protein
MVTRKDRYPTQEKIKKVPESIYFTIKSEISGHRVHGKVDHPRP